jgi:uncharacterized protein YkwD
MGTFYDLLAYFFPSLRPKSPPIPPVSDPWVTPTPEPPPVPSPAPAPPPSDLVTALNAERVRTGLPPFREDPRLTKAAQAWADQMAAARRLWHGDFAHRLVDVIPAALSDGEDIAAGQPTVRDVVRDWMESPPHRANILGNYNRVGCGQATSSTGAIFWCVDFARVNN